MNICNEDDNDERFLRNRQFLICGKDHDRKACSRSWHVSRSSMKYNIFKPCGIIVSLCRGCINGATVQYFTFNSRQKKWKSNEKVRIKLKIEKKKIYWLSLKIAAFIFSDKSLFLLLSLWLNTINLLTMRDYFFSLMTSFRRHWYLKLWKLYLNYAIYIHQPRYLYIQNIDVYLYNSYTLYVARIFNNFWKSKHML